MNENKTKHTMLTELSTAGECDLRNQVTARDLLLDIKSLAKEYYTMTFTLFDNEAKIMFNIGQSFKLIVTEL